MSTYTLNVTKQLTVLDCPSCGMTFGITADFAQRRRDDHVWFYCPAGHKQHFDGLSDAEKARRRAERLERQLANRDEDLRSARASLIATKGQLTKARNRADRGVCQHCHRSFVNVANHVKTKHPEAADKGISVAARSGEVL